ncbi:MAG: NAD-dependent epimerase/dehydratase family protein, partial [Candidatus Eisenbacteria bacterium]|nr:NAD-dependent epimerase/dehydratase family protein [Candidatus Eisenbacteria bacterium]
MRVAVTGAGGLVGAALVPALAARGHRVTRLVRRAPRAADERAWDPRFGLDDDVLRGVDAIVHLAGESIGAGRWTTARRRAILESRAGTTRR